MLQVEFKYEHIIIFPYKHITSMYIGVKFHGPWSTTTLSRIKVRRPGIGQSPSTIQQPRLVTDVEEKLEAYLNFYLLVYMLNS